MRSSGPVHEFPAAHAGSPVWSPSGKFIAFVAEKPDHPGNSMVATPGWGGYSDLWVASADGSHAWQLTDVPADKDHGTIIPEFSPDGRLLEWTERTKVPPGPQARSLRRVLGDQGRQFQRQPRWHAIAV